MPVGDVLVLSTSVMGPLGRRKLGCVKEYIDFRLLARGTDARKATTARRCIVGIYNREVNVESKC
jgi:hypothetical protein